MGIDIISWRILIGVFSPKAAIADLTTTGIVKSTSSSHCDPLKLNRNVMIFLTVLAFTSLLVICMDIEVNPGPTSTPQFTSLFNTTKRIQLKLIRYQHHLKIVKLVTLESLFYLYLILFVLFVISATPFDFEICITTFTTI